MSFPEIFFLVCVVVFVGALIINVYIPSMYSKGVEVKSDKTFEEAHQDAVNEVKE